MHIKSPLFIFILSFGLFNTASTAQENPIENKSLREIIFWGPSPAELDTINEDETEVYSDYYFYISQASSELRKLSIQLKDTTSSVLNLEYGNDSIEIFERKPGSTAYIFNDGNQKPKRFSGVLTDAEIISAAKEFFRIP